MRVAVAGVPGAWSSERMADALRRQDVETFVFSLSDCLHDLKSRTVTVHGYDLRELDAIVVKKVGVAPSASGRLRLHLLRELEAQGVRVYSSPNVIERVMDRYRMTMILCAAGLPIPETFAFESEASLAEAARRLESTVVKPVYTSKGRGFVRINSQSGDDCPFDGRTQGTALAQRFIESPGRDIGACVLGGRFAGAFYRVAAEGQWLTTTAAGGRYAPCDLPSSAQQLAEEAAGAFRLDYTVVDLVHTSNGYLIYEVSAFGGFRGLWEAYRIDVAEKYATYIRGDVYA